MSESKLLMDILDWPAFGLNGLDKRIQLFSQLSDLTAMHNHTCRPYHELLSKMWIDWKEGKTLEELPFLPVRLFKHERFLSVPESEIVKTMTSSGTTGSSVSQIFLDKQTSALQVKVLSRIVGDFVGSKRLPMLVIDCRASVADRLRFSARTAGILGFSMFGRDIEYALDDDMQLNEKRVNKFIAKYPDQPILLFGFTFIVWLHLIRQLEITNSQLALKNGILIHGGGWKKLQSQAVSALEFKHRLAVVSGIERVHSYYGMVEQTGSIFMECQEGHLHAPAWSDVIIRDPIDFKPLPIGQRGLIQLLSVIPRSYPGHSLLSEDEGEILGIDSCRCGRKGAYFRVLGRIENAEIRGCSDTYTR